MFIEPIKRKSKTASMTATFGHFFFLSVKGSSRERTAPTGRASVSVAIVHLKGFTVEFHTACRAAEGDPQFLVESVQGYQVCPVVKKHLIETAGPEKSPAVF